MTLESRRQHTVRARRDPFVGREAMLGAMDAHFRAGERMLTLVGAGGIGKTRLALEFALRLAQDPAERGDGVLWCECAEARTLDELTDALIAALDVAVVRSASAPIDRAAAALASQGRVLLVLDNLEQAIDSAALLVERLLARAPEARILATSRARLRIAEERALEVGPLSVLADGERDEAALRACEAVALFVLRAERASGARPLSLGLAELRAIGALTARLEGLPLAIELCAARITTFSPAQALAALELGSASLGGARGGSSRHATVRDAIAWSWNLLSSDEQQALAQLSVCRGGFDLDAARALLGALDPARAIEIVASLHEQSLLRTVDALGETQEEDRARAPRFAMFEAVRVFAAEQLDSGPDGAARAQAEARHGRYFTAFGAALVELAQAQGEIEAARRARAELANCVAAFEHERASDPANAPWALVGLAPLMVSSMALELANSLADRAVTVADAASDPALRARARWTRGEVRRRQSLADAEQDFLGALSLIESPTDHATRALRAQCLLSLGVARRDLGQLEEASATLDQARALAAPTGRAAAMVAITLATVRRRQGLVGEATGWCEHAMAIGRRLEDRYIEARAQLVLALLDDDGGRLDAALSRYERAVELFRACADRWNEEITLNAMALLYVELGRFVEARAHYDEALAICDELGLRSGAACVLGNMGWLELATGDSERAIERWHQSIAVAREVGHRFFEASSTASLAAIEARLDRVESARAAFATAEQRVSEYPSPSLRALLDVLRGVLDLAEARLARARQQDARAAQWEQSARDRLARARALPDSVRDGDVRTAERLLVTELSPASDARRGAAWIIVWGACEAFQVEGGERVDLRRFGVHRRVLAELIAAHEREPAARRSVAELFSAVWPGERVGVRSMRNRVHVALCALRKAGLASALESHAEGYRLALGVRVERR